MCIFPVQEQIFLFINLCPVQLFYYSCGKKVSARTARGVLYGGALPFEVHPPE